MCKKTVRNKALNSRDRTVELGFVKHFENLGIFLKFIQSLIDLAKSSHALRGLLEPNC